MEQDGVEHPSHFSKCPFNLAIVILPKYHYSGRSANVHPYFHCRESQPYNSVPLAIGGGVLGDCWKPEQRGQAADIYTLALFLGPVIRSCYWCLFWSTSIADGVIVVLAFVCSPLLTLVIMSAERDLTARAASLISRVVSNIVAVKVINIASYEYSLLARVDIAMNLLPAIWGVTSSVFWACLIATSNLQMALPPCKAKQQLQNSQVSCPPTQILYAPPNVARLRNIRRIMPRTPTGDFALTNLTFSYPSCPTIPVLREVDMYIPTRETTFIVGPSSCGKSTLGSIRLGYYAPERRSALDKQDVQYLDSPWLRRRVAGVAQAYTRLASVQVAIPHDSSRQPMIEDDDEFEGDKTNLQRSGQQAVGTRAKRARKSSNVKSKGNAVETSDATESHPSHIQSLCHSMPHLSDYPLQTSSVPRLREPARRQRHKLLWGLVLGMAALNTSSWKSPSSDGSLSSATLPTRVFSLKTSPDQTDPQRARCLSNPSSNASSTKLLLSPSGGIRGTFVDRPHRQKGVIVPPYGPSTQPRRVHDDDRQSAHGIYSKIAKAVQATTDLFEPVTLRMDGTSECQGVLDPPIEGALVLENVSFAYLTNPDTPVLSNPSMKIAEENA
ncbi:hypothetical protein BU15DRAFT_75616 [Melanogaster broomeanus]|nr:hypothetical protein BU15DRAFT_75616 [Melanogaster broomeanus]